MEASVPVFGNCCLDLPADADGVSEDTVFADVDASVDSDSEGAVLGFVTSSSVLVKSEPGITAVLPDGVVTVALPLLSTTTVEPGLTALTLSSITFFSSGVKAFGSDTTVLSAGVFIEVLVLVDALWLADVLADADALADADSDALVDADSDALVLADWLALVDAD